MPVLNGYEDPTGVRTLMNGLYMASSQRIDKTFDVYFSRQRNDANFTLSCRTKIFRFSLPAYQK